MAFALVAMAAIAMLLTVKGSQARAEGEPEFSPLAGCIAGKFCTWTGASYTGEEANFNCGSIGVNYELRAAKNHCSTNMRIGWLEGGVITWKACMAPGGERPEPGRFNEVVPNAC